MKFHTFLETKGCAEVIQSIFKSKLPTTEEKELDASTKHRKTKKLAKTKNAMMMTYATQCLNGTTLLNAIFNIHAERLTNWKSMSAV